MTRKVLSSRRYRRSVCRDNLIIETKDPSSSAPGSVILDKEALLDVEFFFSAPIYIIGSPLYTPATRPRPMHDAIDVAESGEGAEEEDVEDCLICLQPLSGCDEEEAIREWGCGHHSRFHPGCIRQWLESSPVCPICRDVVVSDGEEEEEEGARRGSRRQRRRRGGFFRRYRDGIRDAFSQRQSCTRGVLFAVSTMLACLYFLHGEPSTAACCLLAWGLVALQDCAQTCSYIWISLAAFVCLHLWMCHRLGSVCASPQILPQRSPELCNNFMVLVYGHLFVCIYGLMYTMTTSLQQAAARYEAMVEDA